MDSVCTRIFFSENSVAKVAGRTLDFREKDEPRLWWLPAGQERRGHPENDNLTWTSRHASLSITEWRNATVDGMNDKGLAVHALMYTTAGYESADGRPDLAISMWAQYVIDNFATVAEALDGLAQVRVAPVAIHGQEFGMHLAIEDVSGDSAIIEPIDGAMVVHHGPQYTIMANSPSFEEQQANLRRYRPFGGELPPPGDIISLDRFVRASYFLHYLPEPADNREAVAGIIHIASNAAKPFGAPYPSGEVYPTRWISVVDLTNLDYYFWSRLSPSLLWVSMSDLQNDGNVRSVDPFDPSLAGDVADAMVPSALT